MTETVNPEAPISTPKETDHLFPDPLRTLLWNAVLEGATDVHLNPTERGLRVLYRTDGILHVRQRLSDEEGRQIVNQVHGAAELKATRIVVPEEGQIILRDGLKEWDFRVTIVPVGREISAHLRILDMPEAFSDLTQLGFGQEDQDAIRDIVQSLSGLLLIGGSTGTAKTTTLYSIASLLDTNCSSVYSIEDPVEFRLHDAQHSSGAYHHAYSHHDQIEKPKTADKFP